MRLCSGRSIVLVCVPGDLNAHPPLGVCSGSRPVLPPPGGLLWLHVCALLCAAICAAVAPRLCSSLCCDLRCVLAPCLCCGQSPTPFHPGFHCPPLPSHGTADKAAQSRQHTMRSAEQATRRTQQARSAQRTAASTQQQAHSSQCTAVSAQQLAHSAQRTARNAEYDTRTF